jgi:hypothetical protein
MVEKSNQYVWHNYEWIPQQSDENGQILSQIGDGENHIGEVGGNSNTLIATPTITAGAYAANDIVGGIQTLTNAARISGKEVVLESVVVTDLAAQNATLKLFIFDRNPSNGTYTDNANLDINDTDMGYCIGCVTVSQVDYDAAADKSVATVRNIGLLLSPNTTNLYVVAKTTETPTYTSTSDLTFKYGFLRD